MRSERTAKLMNRALPTYTDKKMAEFDSDDEEELLGKSSAGQKGMTKSAAVE